MWRAEGEEGKRTLKVHTEHTVSLLAISSLCLVSKQQAVLSASHKGVHNNRPKERRCEGRGRRRNTKRKNELETRRSACIVQYNQ